MENINHCGNIVLIKKIESINCLMDKNIQLKCIKYLQRKNFWLF